MTSEIPIFLPQSLYDKASRDPRYAHHCRPGGILAPVPLIVGKEEEKEKTMSFSLSIKGDDKEDAIAKLAEAVESSSQGPIPDGVQNCVESVINAMPDTGGRVSVSAHGHFHQDESGTSSFEISVSNQLRVDADPSAEIDRQVPRDDG